MLFTSIDKSLTTRVTNALVAEAIASLQPGASIALSSLQQGAFKVIEDQFTSVLNVLPSSQDSQEWISTIIKKYQDSRIVQYCEAKQRFEKVFYSELVNAKNISGVLKDIIDDYKKHEQEITELVVIGATAGTSAFVIGTIYQIFYDIISAFVTLIQYAYYGAVGLATYAYNAVAGESKEPAIDYAAITQFFTSFDLEGFLTNDLPELADGVIQLCYDVLDDFINNAEKYGTLVANYVTDACGGVLSGTMSLFLQPYDSNASLPSRVWWGVTQWFNLGALLGPVIVDVILFFCSGGTGGVVSATTKLGKLEKVGDALRYTKKAMTLIEDIPAFANIIKKIPTRIKTLIIKIFQQLWDATGAFADKFKDLIIQAYKAANNSALPSMEEIALRIDDAYDTAEGINFFIAICLMFFGGSINEEGAYTI